MDQLNISNILNREHIKKDIELFLKDFYDNKRNISITRGIYLHGETGIGKTYFVKELLKDLNYDIIYYDASDSRNKNIIQNISKNTLSDTNVISMFRKDIKKIVIIMDEIDGMNNGDKGGINNLIKLVRPKKTKKQKKENYIMIPIICIGNNKDDKKILELKKVCKTIKLHPPSKEQIINILKKQEFNIEESILKNIVDYVKSDLRELSFIINLYKSNPNLLTNNILNSLVMVDSFNENTKDITNNLLVNKYELNDYNTLINETDRTSVSLLFHENIIEVLNKKNKKDNILFYLKFLQNIVFSDYIDRITFQKQVWIFNEMTSLIKIFYNNKLLHENVKNIKKLSNVRFTKVLTKYSTEYNNNVFIDGLCQKLNVDKKDLYFTFCYLIKNYDCENISKNFNTDIISELDIKRIIRFLENVYDTHEE